MLCSDCSAVIRPVVAIDIDGTLGDYHGHFLKFAADYLGVASGAMYESELYTGQEEFGPWFCKRYKVDLTTFRQIKLAYRQGGMKRTMPVYPDAERMVSRIREKAEVWLTTTRPYLRLDNVDPDTRFWLDRNQIEYDGMLYDEDKYTRLAELVDPKRLVAVLDDLGEQYAAAQTQFGAEVPIYRLNGYNEAVSGCFKTTVQSLAQAEMEIFRRITEWEAKHA